MNAKKIILVISIMHAMQPTSMWAIDNPLSDDLIDIDSIKMGDVQSDEQVAADPDSSVDQPAERLLELTLHTPLAYLKIASDELFIELLLVAVVAVAIWHYTK